MRAKIAALSLAAVRQGPQCKSTCFEAPAEVLQTMIPVNCHSRNNVLDHSSHGVPSR